MCPRLISLHHTGKFKGPTQPELLPKFKHSRGPLWAPFSEALALAYPSGAGEAFSRTSPLPEGQGVNTSVQISCGMTSQANN